MSYLNRLLKFILSRQALTVAAITLAIMAVWFIGPLLAFGDYRPLLPVSARVIVIVALLALLSCRLLRWSTSLVWLLLLGLALWHIGPLLALGDVQPLKTAWSRVLLISVLAACTLGYGVYRLWQAMRSDDALLQRILHPFAGRARQEAAAAPEGFRANGAALDRALGKLRGLRGWSSGWRRAFQSQQYLYELPWYMVLGSPGSGKTTLIANSGLGFPDPERMAAAARANSATEHIDCWLANEAVLIDTAGRYSVHDAAVPDAAEWRGVLDALRKRRQRAPLNGVVLAVSADELLTQPAAQRVALAASLRTRLAELREGLGIRFPVYLCITKLDVLPGFAEYFQSLTAEGRAQVLGFTLPHRDGGEAEPSSDLRADCERELRLLAQRLDAGVNLRLQEEYEIDQRRKLYVLPDEFRSFATTLSDWLGRVFLDSRYDNAPLCNALRGVYFTSAAQTQAVVPADRLTVLQRLHRGLAEQSAAANATSAAPVGHRAYFLRTLFVQVIVPEGHLVRPNLRWEFRFRTLRTVGHLMSATLGMWLVGALAGSYDNNRGYLAEIDRKTTALERQVAAYRRVPQSDAMSGVLSASRELPQVRDLDLDGPGAAWRYGLYTAPRVADAANATYVSLLRQTLLPQVVGRVETELGAQLDARDADGVYRVLSTYLSLYDRSHYDAAAIRAWVLEDWERTATPAETGERDVFARHLGALFANDKPPLPVAPQRADLVQRARDFLGSNPIADRLYKRAIAAMQKDAPESVTLMRAAGPQAAAVFALDSGSTLTLGVPGLYTSDGYREVFEKRLPAFLDRAQAQDAWVMGRPDARTNSPRGLGSIARGGRERLAAEIRRQYLTDYGNYWQRFLEDIRHAAAIDDGTLASELQALRTLAAPDSPLVRLARVAARETSLLIADATAGDGPSLADSALTAAGKHSRAMRAASMVAGTVLSADQVERLRMEKELVDDRFSALHEVVTGRGDAGGGRASTVAGALSLDAIVGLINEQYARLSVVGTALDASGMPQVDDVGATLALEASKMPPPFRTLLTGIASRSMQKVNSSAGSLLSRQIGTSVGAQCRRLIEGRYPFAQVAHEVDIDDFSRVFAPGGLLDDFFQKTLAGRVDTSQRPWRYQPVSPGMPPVAGPSLEPFERAAAIRDAFFHGSSAARPSWKTGIRVVSLDPTITDLTLDLDGQTLRYAHGPVTVFPVVWPGPRSGETASITANPRVRPDTSTFVADGPWALFRLLDRGRVNRTSSPSRLTVDFNFDDRHAVLELVGSGQADPVSGSMLRGFRCPDAAAV
ncbi:type VI secretion system membrane subunit TssM [Burkholderia sp. JSH-S8]|nr:type VI secretion system membrane subunit TssM [Burkholderia sp. JSH-S8]